MSDQFTQTQEPVTPPPGFGSPQFRIGERVKVVFTTLAPAFLKNTEGKVGAVESVVFCRSDGKTILYVVKFDGEDAGGRYESFELNHDDSPPPTSPKKELTPDDYGLIRIALYTAIGTSLQYGHTDQANLFRELDRKLPL